ncbi:glycoside hydrolase family 88/105 protein [Asticcacaulis biprosthecium]|nr:glycoside hydrolase family 88 protein [Asticcacaulis biprosthecium]
MRQKPYLRLFASLVALAGLAIAPVAALSAPAATGGSADATLAARPMTQAEILMLAEKVANYQIAMLAAGQVHPRNAADSTDPKGWVQGAFFIGLTHLADRSQSPQYRDFLIARGESNRWELGRRLYHADDHTVGQAYVWASRHGAGPAALAPMRKAFDLILANPSRADLAFVERPAGAGDPLCFDRWCWCDALFMSPPAFIELSQVTGDPRYAAFAKTEFWAATDYLQDKESGLYFRDSRFFDRRGENGEKVFWSRGNGWVFAGLANILTHLPETDPDRARFEALFKTMATRLISIQKSDGYWNASLLGDPGGSLPESSGTGFFVYGLAWGIRSGLLDPAVYAPHVELGWQALTRSVHDNGKLGWVQPISDRPELNTFDDSQIYGVGAFLLAATAVSDLQDTPGVKSKSRRKR